ncbi:MAG: thiolase C-terminal domain-containing protein, partial [Candidatus Odinarchaeia archaeon]
ETGSASGGSAFISGFKDVASGLHDFVLVGGVEKMSEVVSTEAQAILSQSIFQDYETIHGLSIEGAAAMIMRYYMHKFKITHEDIAYLAMQDHQNAVTNPYAQLPFEVTIDKIVNSRPIAEPITLMDCAPIGDGAVAVVLCPLEKAKKFTKNEPIIIAGVGESTEPLPLNQREDLLSFKSKIHASQKAYKMAKITPKEIQIAEIFDPYTITGIIALEDLGFAKKGKATELLKEGFFSKNGEKPINISGGLKARGHPIGATGVYQIAEIAMALRGEEPLKLEKQPEIGLTQATSGLGALTTISILKRS